jgi:Zn-dependent protease
VLLGLSFIFQQFVMKSISQTYGASTKYKLWLPGLLAALVVGVFTLGEIVVFAVGFNTILPYYASRLSKKSVKIGEDERGRIALSGVLANLAMAFLVKLLSPFLANNLWMAAVNINLWMAFFYALPIPPLNGSFIFVWDRAVWAVTFVSIAACLVLMLSVSLLWVVPIVAALAFITFLFMMGFKLV